MLVSPAGQNNQTASRATATAPVTYTHFSHLFSTGSFSIGFSAGIGSDGSDSCRSSRRAMRANSSPFSISGSGSGWGSTESGVSSLAADSASSLPSSVIPACFSSARICCSSASSSASGISVSSATSSENCSNSESAAPLRFISAAIRFCSAKSSKASSFSISSADSEVASLVNCCAARCLRASIR